jgi:DNA-binding CsgD family transcriptional regulator
MPLSQDDHVIELLTQILRVQALQAAGSKSITEASRLLKLAGLDNQTIADVLNTSPATIRTVTANLRFTSMPRGRRKGRKAK